MGGGPGTGGVLARVTGATKGEKGVGSTCGFPELAKRKKRKGAPTPFRAAGPGRGKQQEKNGKKLPLTLTLTLMSHV